MYLRTLAITNLRALEEIRIEFDQKVNVIVGPNAVGKTTILEAIRLAKALLAPRTQNEATQVLFSLGASSPHFAQRIRLDAIARDPQKPVIIRCNFKLSEQELSAIRMGIPQVAMSLVQNRIGQAFANPSALIGFLASPQGRQQLLDATNEITVAMESLNRTRTCYLEVEFNLRDGIKSNTNGIEAALIAFLEQRLPPHQTAFTYFPADRALPTGEQPVQLGAADAVQQLESYNSQPQTKYSRLKNLIFSATVVGDEIGDSGTKKLYAEFEQIFHGILKGRKLLGPRINEIGLLSVPIQDIESGRIFDLDAMSSGEKGLILTFLLIERSIVQDGIILLDEPELHLNPAVCKDLLAYLVDEYVVRKNLQIIICSHSPEILAGALSNETCSLYRLESENVLTKVRNQDHVIVQDTLRELGYSESDDLLFKGVIYVEGIDDINILEAGFNHLLKRYKLKDSKGRKEIEKAISSLQKEESQGKVFPKQYFILDNDSDPLEATSTSLVKILQWDRRCLENYLLDIDVLADLFMNPDVIKPILKNHAETLTLFREKALGQMDELCSRKVYNEFKYEGIGLRKEDIKGMPLEQISSLLATRIRNAQTQLASFDQSTWELNFTNRVKTERDTIRREWETDWPIKCDGKRLFVDVRTGITLTMDLRKFKIRIMKEMTERKTPLWIDVENKISLLLSS